MLLNDTLWHPLPLCGDPRLRRWLVDRGSLTRRIQHCCNEFRLDVLSQHAAIISEDERAAIGLKAGARCLEREVSLNCDGTPVVFAHSVVAPRALKGPWRLLVGLGSRPLGAALFADPRIERRPLHFQRLNARHVLHQRACRRLNARLGALWARRSIFVLCGSPLLVTEVFLPAILALAPS